MVGGGEVWSQTSAAREEVCGWSRDRKGCVVVGWGGVGWGKVVVGWGLEEHTEFPGRLGSVANGRDIHNKQRLP